MTSTNDPVSVKKLRMSSPDPAAAAYPPGRGLVLVKACNYNKENRFVLDMV